MRLASALREVSVTVRANYVGLPSMAGRGTDNAAKAAWLVQSPEVRLRGRNRRKWSAERRGIRNRMSTPERMGLH